VRFTEKFPGIEVVVQEDTTARLLKLWTAMRSTSPWPASRFKGASGDQGVVFGGTPSCLAPRPSPRPQRTVAAADLEGERLIVMKDGHCLGDQVLGFCDRRDVKPKISFRSSQIETIQALVASGLGISLIPSMAAQDHNPDKPQYRSFQSPKPKRKIVAVWPKHRAPGRAAIEFLTLIPPGSAPN